MLRVVEEDYARLCRYIDTYRISSTLGSKSRGELLKRAHKMTLVCLQMYANSSSLLDTESLVLGNVKVVKTSDCYLQICESFSDVVSALFSFIHGLYKPGNMSLRSAIETFVRGVSGLESNDALNTTSVFRLFELAADVSAFKGLANSRFQSMQQAYAELCLHAHSAERNYLVGNIALASFPRQDTESLKVSIRLLERTTKAIASILILLCPRLYLECAPRARDLLDETIPSEIRLRVLQGH